LPFPQVKKRMIAPRQFCGPCRRQVDARLRDSTAQRSARRQSDFDALPFGRLWYGEPNAISYAQFYSRSHDAVIRVYDEAGNMIETHEHAGEFTEW